MIWYIKENPEKAKELAEIKKWKKEKERSSKEDKSNLRNDSDFVNKEFSILQDIFSSFIFSITQKKINELDKNDIQIIAGNLKEFQENSINRKKSSRINISEITKVFESLDLSNEKARNFLKKFNKMAENFNTKNKEELK